MIDRLELFTSLNITESTAAKLAGQVKEFSGQGLGKLDKFSFNSKLVREDEDVKDLKTSDLNALYRHTLVERIVADSKEMEQLDDPVTFILFAHPRFKREQRAKYKIVCNPNNTPLHRLRDFLHNTFQRFPSWTDARFYSAFRLGRVDFCIDVDTHTVEELFRSIFISRKLRKHIGVLDLKKELDQDREGYVRVISSTVLETFYCGKSGIVFRCYDKVKEALHQIQVCKAQGWKVSEKVIERSLMKLLTRLEMQIRDMGRLGLYDETNKKTGEISTCHVKRRMKQLALGEEEIPGYYFLEDLWDLLNTPEARLDVFREVKFVDSTRYSFGNENWKDRSFAALVREVGFDEAMRILPANARRQMKQDLVSFTVDLNHKLYQEVRTWID